MPQPFKSVPAAKNEIVDFIRFRLGDGMVDVEADKEHYEVAIATALMRYRQMAEHGTKDSVMFLPLEKEQPEYILPDEVVEVRQVFRHGVGSITGNTTTYFEPFSAGYLNSYMLPAGKVGGLLTYELFSQYQEQVMRMFGGYMNFTFDKSTKKLTLVRKVAGSGEVVGLLVNLRRSDIELFNDPQVYPWLLDYAYASAMFTIGEAREKFQQINGPNGGSSLNGTQLKTEGKDLMGKLVDELRRYVDGSNPLSFIIG